LHSGFPQWIRVGWGGEVGVRGSGRARERGSGRARERDIFTNSKRYK